MGERIPENKMGTMPVGKLLADMAIPMMISMLVQALYNVVDSVFVSRISENALNAVSLAFPLQNLMIAFGSGTAVGMNALLSRSLGAKQQEQVDRAANTGIFLFGCTYVLFALIGAFLSRPFFLAQTHDAEIVGYGATCDAHHITAPLADGSGGAKAMAMALTDGGVSPEQVGYINAHGTSTHLNDAGETAAVKTVFGPHAYQLAMSSTKSMTGHMLGAAGAVEAIFTALSLRDGFLPATIHYQTPDPDCDLDVVPNEGRPADIRYALSNSLGFGGHNGSLLLKKWED